MGCGCKTNQQISYLQQKYGDKQPKSKKTHIKESISIAIQNILLVILVIPVVPIVAIVLILKHIFSKKPIDINKVFKIKSNL